MNYDTSTGDGTASCSNAFASALGLSWALDTRFIHAMALSWTYTIKVSPELGVLPTQVCNYINQLRDLLSDPERVRATQAMVIIEKNTHP